MECEFEKMPEVQRDKEQEERLRKVDERLKISRIAFLVLLGLGVGHLLM